MTQSALGDPFSPAARPNAYPLDAHLRAASRFISSPFQRAPAAEQALRDPRSVKAGPFGDLSPEIRPLTKHMLNCDPPDHARLRAGARSISPGLVEQLRQRIQHIADELLVRSRPAVE